MKTLLHPTYFPNIITFAVILKHDILWETADNYQKQTYRNRCYICTDQGKHMLSIPIKHAGGDQGRQRYKEVALDNSYSWQRQHWRTLQTAYRTSPYFEYYEEELAPLFENPFKFLLDFNLQTIAAICSCLDVEMPTDRTAVYEVSPDHLVDKRVLVNAKKHFKIAQQPYVQVFGDRHGFIENLSVLDLIFNEGPSTVTFLETMDLTIPNA
ncbi:MAG: WbqC family protein [Flavobacteriaceae bacterium]